MADDAASAHGLAALATSVSLCEALLKQGVIDQATVEAVLKEASLYAQALCLDCPPEVERETQRLLKQIRLPSEPATAAEPPTAAADEDR
jgi:hypothetical protein